MNPHAFSTTEIEAVYRVMRERRDMRHFSAEPLADGQLARLIEAAHLAPSVGYMQPWRFLRVADPALRARIHQHVSEECERTAQALPERAAQIRQLKLEGIESCAEVLVVALAEKREPYVLGRRTMPEMDLASVACAIQNMWLAARAEGIGLGWVSIFEPDYLRALCKMPPDSQPVAILCIGPVPEFYPAPMLETAGWDSRRPLSELVYRDSWGTPDTP
ncbi:5,6-dimethylbenzimidazole synthase [Craterilacuibacter sp. RT1T]|uniref:5,6-dimethylbenzimidazole synthase n=1 Tax=Craterilacuibacter sp. RT1T TaxID=2942211 RepID=UPI0020BDE397|nr:5,6-dimethylbenzimidazole synthase [Craterilacuibacter sp. RT1T]MCL6264668.1 5,6-dimethylbenzimidazole synthase [Craterilacuibacter sp. RT1T]